MAQQYISQSVPDQFPHNSGSEPFIFGGVAEPRTQWITGKLGGNNSPSYTLTASAPKAMKYSALAASTGG